MDGRGDPPPKENSHHIPEGPPEVQKDNKETNKKGKALQTGNTQEDTSTNQPGAAMPMPGGLRLSMTLGSSTNQGTRDVAEKKDNLLSPLTPQQTENNISWLSLDPAPS
ncbi:hypothetical protein EV401DRAFT_1894412 [Pisolithus croceorrhizus]|nr:hypothetical protein EV401DRAFT_1894412 [Pisolithus croceorrhizus]